MADFEELVRGAAADVAPEDTVGARSPGKLSLTSALARRTPRPVRDAAMAPATEARLERAIGDGGDDAPAAGVPYLARDLVPSSTLGRMEAGLGQSFGDVRMVADSSALGSAHAATRGEEVQFAPGKFAPGTATGDWLLAHELSHVVQQRQGSSDALQAFAPRTRRGVLEREADAAADAVVSGGRAQIVHGAEAGVEQRYEAWEHADLGNLGADAGDEMLIPYGNPPRYITYGQLVALSGDFYASAGEMHHDMDANPDTIDRVRGVMDEERRAAAGGTGRVWDERAGGYVDVEGRPADHGYIDWLFDWAKPGGGSANHHAEEFGGVGAVGAGAAARGHGHNHGDDTADRDLSRWRPPGEEGHDDHEGHEGPRRPRRPRRPRARRSRPRSRRARSPRRRHPRHGRRRGPARHAARRRRWLRRDPAAAGHGGGRAQRSPVRQGRRHRGRHRADAGRQPDRRSDRGQ
jgi:hypothetical protein